MADKLTPVGNCQYIPLALLLLALSSVFLFGGERARFYRPGTNGVATANC